MCSARVVVEQAAHTACPIGSFVPTRPLTLWVNTKFQIKSLQDNKARHPIVCRLAGPSVGHAQTNTTRCQKRLYDYEDTTSHE